MFPKQSRFSKTLSLHVFPENTKFTLLNLEYILKTNTSVHFVYSNFPRKMHSVISVKLYRISANLDLSIHMGFVVTLELQNTLIIVVLICLHINCILSLDFTVYLIFV